MRHSLPDQGAGLMPTRGYRRAPSSKFASLIMCALIVGGASIVIAAQQKWTTFTEAQLPGRLVHIEFVRSDGATMGFGGDGGIIWGRWTVKAKPDTIVEMLDKHENGGLYALQIQPLNCTNDAVGTVPCKMMLYKNVEGSPLCYVSPPKGSSALKPFDIECPAEITVK
jgi:hypothetical protein